MSNPGVKSRRRIMQRLVDCGYLAVADDGQYCRPDCLDASPGWD
jgi:hypothetical protein